MVGHRCGQCTHTVVRKELIVRIGSRAPDKVSRYCVSQSDMGQVCQLGVLGQQQWSLFAGFCWHVHKATDLAYLARVPEGGG